ncbi:hypothetical protein AcV7_002518 [Taiwanofungus camphoratus]|nr:hypothetical protein AcV7_002518 [Antrodia cinnamomea]
MQGAGSINSPIVISDDEDEAYVEQQLQGTRLSPAWETPSRGDGFGESACSHTSTPDAITDKQQGSFTGSKRKWDEMSVPRPVVHPPHPSVKARGLAVAPTTHTFSAEPLGESRTARKKRRRREREAAQVEQQIASPMHPIPSRPLMNNPGLQPGNVPSRLEERDAHALPANSHSFDALVTPSTNPLGMLIPDKPHATSLPLKPSALTTSLGEKSGHLALSTYSSPSANIVPLNSSLAQGVAHVYPYSDAIPPPTSEPTQCIAKKTIGMLPDADPHKKHGLFSFSNQNMPASSPDRTLIMELLPKKFRSQSFVQKWAKHFDAQPLRVELDTKSGKALIEFANAGIAREAFNSPRLSSGEGREHVRVWWYRAENTAMATDLRTGDLEEGEIEENVRGQPLEARLHNKKAKSKQKVAKKKLHENGQKAVSSSSLQLQQQNSIWSSFYGPQSSADRSQRDFPMQIPLQTCIPAPSHYNWVRAAIEVGSSAGLSNGRVTTTHDLGEDVPMSLEEEAMDLGSDDGYGDAEAPAQEDLYYDEQSIASSRPGSPMPEVLPDDQVSGSKGVANDVRPPSPADKSSSSSITSTTPAVRGPELQTLNCHTESPKSRSRKEHEPPNGLDEYLLQSTSPFALEALNNNIVYEHPAYSPACVSQLPESNEETIGDNSLSLCAAIPSASDSLFHASAIPLLSHTAAIEGISKAPLLSKRSLLERQKELQARIVRTKEELARKTAATSGTSSSTGIFDRSCSLEVAHDSVGSNLNADSVSKGMTPAELRHVVSQSRSRNVVVTSTDRSGSNTPAPSTFEGDDPTRRGKELSGHVRSVCDESKAIPTPLPLSSSAGDQSSAAPTTSTSSMVAGPTVDSTASLDELAISFITETIQTVKPPPPRPAQSMEKVQLALKQKRLEQHISESKILMAKLNVARTKEERENILSILRERRRAMEEDLKADSSLTASPAPSTPPLSHRQPVYQISKIRWPETSQDATILVISDDESDGDA